MDRMLRQFLMVAELKSVTQAAKRLFVSQPTLTHNMKKLEADLQVDLFVRTSRGWASRNTARYCWSKPESCTECMRIRWLSWAA